MNDEKDIRTRMGLGWGVVRSLSLSLFPSVLGPTGVGRTPEDSPRGGTRLGRRGSEEHLDVHPSCLTWDRGDGRTTTRNREFGTRDHTYEGPVSCDESPDPYVTQTLHHSSIHNYSRSHTTTGRPLLVRNLVVTGLECED